MDSPDLVCTTVVALSGKITRAKAQLPENIILWFAIKSENPKLDVYILHTKENKIIIKQINKDEYKSITNIHFDVSNSSNTFIYLLFIFTLTLLEVRFPFKYSTYAERHE